MWWYKMVRTYETVWQTCIHVFPEHAVVQSDKSFRQPNTHISNYTQSHPRRQILVIFKSHIIQPLRLYTGISKVQRKKLRQACILELSSVSERISGLSDLSFQFRHGQETFHQSFQTGSGAHPASCSMDTGVFTPSAHSDRDVTFHQCPPPRGEVTHTTCPHGTGRDSFYE
jgi:hypothetical protein